MLTGIQTRRTFVRQCQTVTTTSLALFMVAVVASTSDLGAQEDKSNTSKAKYADRLNEILYWLPADTETIIFESGRFKDAKDVAYTSDPRLSDYVRAVQTAFSNAELRRKIMFSVEGSRRFRAPMGFGLMPFQGCEIWILEEGAEPLLTAEMQSLIKKAKKVISLSGNQVAIFTEKMEEDTWTLYVVQPKPDVFLTATNEEFLNIVLTQMAKKPATRAMPADLPEWKYVDNMAPVWAIRHYSKSKDDIAEDPSSPFNKYLLVAPANGSDSEAIGMVFSGDSQTKQATVWYLSRAKEALDIAEKRWRPEADKLHPKFDQLEPGVVRTTVAAKDDDLWDLFMFLLLIQLGHGVVV
jgi:hypothetical protein